MKDTFHAPYSIDTDNHSFHKDTKEGQIQLTNFAAEITEEHVYHDGNATTTILLIRGTMNGGTDDAGNKLSPKILPQCRVTAAEFASGSWIAENWGLTAIVFPTPSSTTDVRACIQIYSAKTSIRTHIYTHTGWINIDKEPAYLAANGAITADGLNTEIQVRLPPELSKYELTTPIANKEDFAAALRTVNIGPRHVMWTLLLATIRAAIGSADFAIHLAGRTGTYKSELASIFQSFYGPKMDARHLPCGWSSTANALEALCYRTKDTITVVDDFVPQGTSYNVKALQMKADNLIRAQGNGAGRSRLTDISNLQQTMYPRGIILSTGEDIPEGHSVRARMMIVEISPGTVDTKKLTEAQQSRDKYNRFMSHFIQWLASTDHKKHFNDAKTIFRERFQEIGHSRTPSIMADLATTALLIAEYAKHNHYYTDQIQAIVDKAIEAITLAGNTQHEYLDGTDPVTIFAEVIRQMLATGQGHIKTKNGGIPKDAPTYGWQVQEHHGDMPTYSAHGIKVGWIDVAEDELYIDPNLINAIKTRSNNRLSVTNQTLIKRLVESGIIARKDTARNRNTVRMVLEGHSTQVLVLRLSAILDLADKQNQ